jgi:signal transduction histidine kinase
LPRQRTLEDDARDKRQQQVLHDVRGAVGAILMLGEVAQLEADDRAVVSRRLREIVGEARWLITLLDSGWDDDAARPLDVDEAVQECVERVRLQHETVIDLRTGGSDEVAAQPVGLRRAVTNVVANAARAAGPDGHVVVRTYDTDGDVVVEVVDDGPGFGQVPIQHGLGLGITREAMAAAGGSVDISDAPDGGTCVRLGLPRRAYVPPPRSGA